MFKRYIASIVELFRMNKEQKIYFLVKANPRPVQIQVLLGLRVTIYSKSRATTPCAPFGMLLCEHSV